jgi:hypothetical protein
MRCKSYSVTSDDDDDAADEEENFGIASKKNGTEAVRIVNPVKLAQAKSIHL